MKHDSLGLPGWQNLEQSHGRDLGVRGRKCLFCANYINIIRQTPGSLFPGLDRVENSYLEKSIKLSLDVLLVCLSLQRLLLFLSVVEVETEAQRGPAPQNEKEIHNVALVPLRCLDGRENNQRVPGRNRKSEGLDVRNPLVARTVDGHLQS
jgi:hypothetical protein